MKSYWIIFLMSTVLSGCGMGSSASSTAATDASTPAVQASKSTTNAVPLTYAQRKGKRLFAHYCAICHGESGAGDGFNAFNLAPTRPRDLTDPADMAALNDPWLREVIREGGRGTRKSVLMPAWGNTLTKDQIEDLVAFIRTLSR